MHNRETPANQCITTIRITIHKHGVETKLLTNYARILMLQNRHAYHYKYMQLYVEYIRSNFNAKLDPCTK